MVRIIQGALAVSAAIAVSAAAIAEPRFTLYVVESGDDTNAAVARESDGAMTGVRIDGRGRENELSRSELRAMIADAEAYAREAERALGADASGKDISITIKDGDSEIDIQSDVSISISDGEDQVVLRTGQSGGVFIRTDGDNGERVTVVGDGDEQNTVIIAGADADAAEDFIDDLDDVSRETKRAMKAALEL
ncbi:MAG: hypothetical protein ACFB2Z_14815 [Maricaulaceae bacterium]